MPGRNVNIPNLHINHIHLECWDYSRSLGITIDNHLTFKNKISRARRHKQINTLYTTVVTIDNTLIIPHLNYVILTWGLYSNRILEIQKIMSC